MAQELSPCLLTTVESARILGMSPAYLRGLQWSRRIPFYQIGAAVRFHPDDLAAFLAGQRREAIR